MDVKNLFIEHNNSSDTSLIFVQGGIFQNVVTDPSTQISSLNLKEYHYNRVINIFRKKVCTKVNFIVPKQVQHIVPNMIINNIDDAKNMNQENIKILHNVIKYQKSLGKKLILMGHSSGSTILQEYISQYSTNNFEKVILTHNKLLFNPHSRFSMKYLQCWTLFNTKGEVIGIKQNSDNSKIKLLFWDLMKNDYVKKLEKLNLDNVYIFSSNGDKLFGDFTSYEKKFLKNKNINYTLFSKAFSRFIKLFYTKDISTGFLAHYIIFSPFVRFKMKKLINSSAKKLVFNYKKATIKNSKYIFLNMSGKNVINNFDE